MKQNPPANPVTRPPGPRRMSAPLLQQQHQQTPYVSTYQNDWGDTREQVESELASQADEVEKSQAENVPVAAAHGPRFPPAFPRSRMSVNQSRFSSSCAAVPVRNNPPFVQNGGVRAHSTGNIRQPGGCTYVLSSPVGSVQGSQHQQAFRPCVPGAPLAAVQLPFRPGCQIPRASGPGLSSSQQLSLNAQGTNAIITNMIQPTPVVEDWQKKYCELQNQIFTETGELKMLRDNRDTLVAETNRYRQEKDQSAEVASRKIAEAEERARNAEQKAKDERVFLEREKAELSEKLRRVEAERQAEVNADIAARDSGLPVPAPPKRGMGSEQDTDGFLTADLFMRSGKKKMRVLSPGASSHVSPHNVAPSPSAPVKKETVTRTVQTDSVNELVRRTRSADSIPPVVYQRDLAKERKLRAYEMIHSLNDSRPVADEQFSLSVLLQPVVNFEPHLAMAKCPANKKRFERIPRKVFKKAMKQFAQNSTGICVPLPLLAQEAVALFLVWRRDKPNGHDHYAHWLAVMVPVLADHLRQYVAVVRNLSAFHAECVGKSKTPELFAVEPEASLSSYFLKVIKCASQPALHYLASLEDNARLALIVLRKLVDLFPDVCRYYLRDNVAVQLEQAEEGEVKPQLTAEQPGTAGFRCRLVDRLASGYRLDSVTADAALKDFARVESVFRLVSSFRLLLTLMDPLQLKMCRKDIMALAASTTTSLAKSVDPAGRQRQVLSTGLSIDVLLNYLSVADSPEQLSSLLDLLGISLRWKGYAVQKCSGENESCLWWNMYANILTIPETKKRDVVGNASTHGQLLSLLLGIIFSEDAEITQLLLAPTRHCVELLITQLAEILYTYVTTLSGATLHSQPALEVFPAVQEFVHSAVLWLYGMKKLMKSYVWNSATRDVAHYLEAVVIILHGERLFEYDQDFDVVLNNFYDEMISNSLARVPGSEESASISSRGS